MGSDGVGGPSGVKQYQKHWHGTGGPTQPPPEQINSSFERRLKGLGISANQTRIICLPSQYLFMLNTTNNYLCDFPKILYLLILKGCVLQFSLDVSFTKDLVLQAWVWLQKNGGVDKN